MTLTISAPITLSSPQSTASNKTNVVAAAPSLNNSAATSNSNVISNNLLVPSPIIQVNPTPELGEGVIESPFIKVTEQLADKNDLNSQNYQQPANIDKTPQQIRSLNEQQQSVQSRQEQLKNQELEIDREISQLRQKELEINRKKFQLQQQATGNILNIQV